MGNRQIFLGMALQAIITAAWFAIGLHVSAPQQLCAAAVFLMIAGIISILKKRKEADS